MIADTCVACGQVVPEGRMVCHSCERGKLTQEVKCAACGDAVHGGQVGCGVCLAIYINPCQGCKNRVVSPNCHDTCDRFRIKKSIDAAIKAKAKAKADIDMVTRTGRDRCIRHNQRKVKIRPKGEWKS